jgi:hypothetical protein
MQSGVIELLGKHDFDWQARHLEFKDLDQNGKAASLYLLYSLRQRRPLCRRHFQFHLELDMSQVSWH